MVKKTKEEIRQEQISINAMWLGWVALATAIVAGMLIGKFLL